MSNLELSDTGAADIFVSENNLSMKTTKLLKLTVLAIGMMNINSYGITDALKIKIARGSYSDETIIRFVDGSTAGFDGSYDAWKLFSSNASVPNIFTKDDINEELSINALPVFDASIIKDVFLKIGTTATYSISATETGAFATGVGIVMKDMVTGTLYNLRTSTTYTVSLPTIAVTAAARFKVFFSFPASIQTNDVSCDNCFDGSSSITKAGESNWQYSVIDSLGNNIAAGVATSEAQNINGLSAGNYSVSITSSFPSTETNSFSIKLNPAPLGATFLDFSAIPEGKIVNVHWSTGIESNTNYFTVENSLDGINYKGIENIHAAGKSSGTINYSASDSNPFSGDSYYRIKLTDLNGMVSYSNTVSVNIKNEEIFSVFPVPASSILNISIDENKNSEVIIIIRDMMGRECYSEKIIPASDHENFSIDISSKFLPGIYTLSASGKEKSFETKIIIN